MMSNLNSSNCGKIWAILIIKAFSTEESAQLIDEGPLIILS